MKIVVGFSSSSLIGSKVISSVESRKYSHAYLRFQDNVTGEWLVTQASHNLVHEISFVNFQKHNKIEEEIELDITYDQYVMLHKVNNHYKGSKYSLLQLVIIGLKKLLNRPLPITRIRGFICSEWVYSLLREANIILINVENPDALTPSDLNTLLKGG